MQCGPLSHGLEGRALHVLSPASLPMSSVSYHIPLEKLVSTTTYHCFHQENSLVRHKVQFSVQHNLNPVGFVRCPTQLHSDPPSWFHKMVIKESA